MCRPIKVMIVDQDLDVRALWKKLGEHKDLIYAVTKGGISAQEHLKTIDYDIDAVVTDLALDDIDGITLTEHIRRNEKIRNIVKGCLIFWCTNYPINDTIESLKEKLGVTEIFSKSMNPNEIIEKVRGYLAVAA